MRRTTLVAGMIAASLIGLSQAALAQTGQIQRQDTPQIQRQNNNVLVARVIDLQPIPSRIEHGVVSVRNTGTAASTPSIATVNCHLPNQQGGCPELPAAAIAAYSNPAYPDRLVVNVPAIQPGHVHNHNLSFWEDISWPSGSYIFEFVVDAGASNNESNEANNAGQHTWVVP
ncbi:MAG: CARDB domain-containing protein [Hyphomonadaceae bacterium]